ncbi:uncharacterized protein OCT59_028890 [Rhizophagus irregularis]|uniref:uncharacterized protein n=1 Tax=Rhizophagus irregularis TaxID=588596 RepID=UPI00332D1F47|nr:hypothetical protein OCT59_028890 [Rhizophagus irregularis]
MLNVVGFFFDNISTKSNNAYANSLSSEKFLMISENLSYIAISSGRIEYLIRDKSDGCIHISSPSNISSNISTSSSNPDTNILSLLNSESKAFKYAISKYHIISFTHSSMLSSNWPSIRLSDGVQSSQHAEVSNKIIKEKLSSASHLSDVVKEVQAAFDNQSKRAITEFKNEIPTKGLPTILNEYFPNLNELLQDFLTPQILQKQRDQIFQSLCYNVTLVTDWLPLLEVRDDFYHERLGRENEYDQPQSLFASLLENIPQSSIMEVWKVIRHRAHAHFHITLILQRWYNDKKFILNQDHA